MTLKGLRFTSQTHAITSLQQVDFPFSPFRVRCGANSFPLGVAMGRRRRTTTFIPAHGRSLQKHVGRKIPVVIVPGLSGTMSPLLYCKYKPLPLPSVNYDAPFVACLRLKEIGYKPSLVNPGHVGNFTDDVLFITYSIFRENRDEKKQENLRGKIEMAKMWNRNKEAVRVIQNRANSAKPSETK